MDKDEALKLALEALESGVKTTANRISWTEYDTCLMNEAITAIKAALAQPAQEPPSEWAGIKAVLDEYGLQAIDFVADFKAALAQPAQEPVAWMTINAYGEEDDIHYENPEGHLLEGWTYKPLYTHPPSVQPQPVSLRRGDILRCIETDELCTVWATSTTGKTLIKWSANNFGSYTAEQIGELFWLEPAQKTKREWVGLTDEEIKEIIGTWGDTPVKGYTRKLFDQIEAKLRSKNNG